MDYLDLCLDGHGQSKQEVAQNAKNRRSSFQQKTEGYK